MTRDETKRRLDELAREYCATHNPNIVEELYLLAREPRRWIKMKDQVNGDYIVSASRMLIGGFAGYRLADLLTRVTRIFD
jgi:hypothetical protein